MDEPEGFAVARRTIELRSQEQLRAVSNLTRHRIIDRLRGGEVSITGIATELGIKKGSASYHLRLLERAGIVEVTRTRKIRGVQQRLYSLTAERFVWPDPLPGAASSVLRAVIDGIEEAGASPEQLVGRRRERVSAARYQEFYSRLLQLIEEFEPEDSQDAEPSQLAVALFREARPAEPTDAAPVEDVEE